MRIAIWGAGSSAVTVTSRLGAEVEVVQVVATEPMPGEQFLGMTVQSPEDLDQSVDEVWICSMFYPEILESCLELGVPLGRIRIFEDHLSTPGVAVNEIRPQSVVQRLDEYRRLQDVRSRVQQLVESAPEISDRWSFLRFAVRSAPPDGLRLELGVFEGESLLFLQRESRVPVWGIDSLVGFDPESTLLFGAKPNPPVQGVFSIEQNEFFIRGRFQDVLVPLLERSDQVTFVHYDASDLLAARFAMSALEGHLAAGAVIVFDEFVPNPHDVDAPEFTAYDEYLERTGQPLELVARWASAVAVRANTVE